MRIKRGLMLNSKDINSASRTITANSYVGITVSQAPCQAPYNNYNNPEIGSIINCYINTKTAISTVLAVSTYHINLKVKKKIAGLNVRIDSDSIVRRD